jgi:AhpD family alkylhydroperoxidase
VNLPIAPMQAHGMRPRMVFAAAAADFHEALRRAQTVLDAKGDLLLELVKTRASQINGCAFCVDMHTKDARAAGESEQRLYALTAWREAPFFSERERAALALTEAMTQITDEGVPDPVYEAAREFFTEPELAALIGEIALINAWNRIAIATRMVAGRYRSQRKSASDRIHGAP